LAKSIDARAFVSSLRARALAEQRRWGGASVRNLEQEDEEEVRMLRKPLGRGLDALIDSKQPEPDV
jgi:hypothetical protein